MKLNQLVVAVSILMLQFLNEAWAADAACNHCGCRDACEKVCRLMREDKKISITCWGCKCEEFCAPGKSCRGCKNCEEVCQDCDSAVCSEPKDFVWFEWEPGCAKHIYTKKKLMKKTITKTVPNFKWVVEDMCPACQSTCPYALVPSGASVPPPPVATARIIAGILMESSKSDSGVVPVSNSSSQ